MLLRYPILSNQEVALVRPRNVQKLALSLVNGFKVQRLNTDARSGRSTLRFV